MRDEWLLKLQTDPLFREVKQNLRECRPVVPVYDHRHDNTEEWKSKCLQQQGFDLCLAVLKIQLEQT